MFNLNVINQIDCFTLQVIFLSVSLILMLLLFFLFYSKKLCKKCTHPSAVALRKYHFTLLKNDNELHEFILNSLDLIKRNQNAEEVYYFQCEDNNNFKMVASSDELIINKTVEKIQFEQNLLNKLAKLELSRKEGDSLSFEINNKKICAMPINIEGFDVGHICVIFDRHYHLESILNSDVVQIIANMLKYRERAGILESALGRCEADLETMMNATPHGVIFLDLDLKIRKMNYIAEDMIGYKIEECQGKLVKNIIKINQYKNDVIENILHKALESEDFNVDNKRYVIINKLKNEFVLRFQAAPIFGVNGTEGVVLICCDAKAEKIIEMERNQRKKESQKHYLELQMEQEQRREVEKALIKSGALASTGTLAASIAHEYNNVNSIAMGNLELLLQMKNLPELAQESLKTIHDMMSRGSEITKELLDYTRNNHTNGNKRENISLIKIAQKAKKMVAKEFEVEGINFYSNFDAIPEKEKDFYNVFVDPNRIQQVILNIVLNARHAMADSKIKSVIFQVGLNDKSPFLNISDTGHGISEEDLGKLFDPYFSTKGSLAKLESQKQFSGSGLGLAICSLIMKKNGGSIDVESKIGKGTSFILSFNEAKVEKLEIDQHDESEKDPKDIELKDGKGKRILVLDDEIDLCRLLKNMFVGHGYEVFTSDDGNEGLEEHKKNPFDMVITDIQMPKMDGLNFLNKLSSLEGAQPKKMIMTGRIVKYEIGDVYVDEFVQKPFDLIDFVNKVQKLLGL